MTEFSEVEDLFSRSTVWVDSIPELYFFRWAWERISPVLNTDGADAALDALTLAYVYRELCYYVCDQNFHEDFWDTIGEFVGDDEMLTPLAVGFLCGRDAGGDGDCPEDATEAMHFLVRGNHERIVAALSSKDDTELLMAFHASRANPVRVVDEDGKEAEADMISDYDSFCRYVNDADFRAEDTGGMDLEECQAAYAWWTNGAEMLEARTDSDCD